MNKTIHQKLTNKYQYTHTSHTEIMCNEDLFASFGKEKDMMKEAARDLLSPRPEAIARLLEMSRAL